VSQFILDDQLDAAVVVPPLQKWTTVTFLRELRPGEQVLDDRIPEILQTLKQATFVTLDNGFWNRNFCHPAYGVVYFALQADEQEPLPALLRALVGHPRFRTRAKRMGKVVRVSKVSLAWWQFRGGGLQQVAWAGTSRKKK
jgi:hypothetical protein